MAISVQAPKRSRQASRQELRRPHPPLHPPKIAWTGEFFPAGIRLLPAASTVLCSRIENWASGRAPALQRVHPCQTWCPSCISVKCGVDQLGHVTMPGEENNGKMAALSRCKLRGKGGNEEGLSWQPCPRQIEEMGYSSSSSGMEVVIACAWCLEWRPSLYADLGLTSPCLAFPKGWQPLRQRSRVSVGI